MSWSELNLETALWRLAAFSSAGLSPTASAPGTETKNGDPHRFHLAPLALNILKRRYEAADKPTGGYVFPAPRSGKAIDTFGKAKKAVDAALKTRPWTHNDAGVA